ncbi:MAG: alanine:cation symporter family protein, partial [Gemmatimonadetes bacterium]|nr:alanine:cation symporter family protein [Gemmatimonadota bacterium]
DDGRIRTTGAPAELRILDGVTSFEPAGPSIAWHEVAVERFYLDPELQRPFTGVIYPGRGAAQAEDGTLLRSRYGEAVESGAPLTMLGFQRGLPGTAGRYIVILSVLLFAVSTAIAWSYYGDRCANYLFGARAILPYKIAFVAMHFIGAIVPLAVVWGLGDVFLAIVIIPNLIALLLLSGQVKEMTESYFERRPWIENREVHRRIQEEKRRGRRR